MKSPSSFGVGSQDTDFYIIFFLILTFSLFNPQKSNKPYNKSQISLTVNDSMNLNFAIKFNLKTSEINLP